MRFALAVLLLACLATAAPAATWYVDVTSGNDTSGNGSQASPWKTMARAEAVATGGDTVYLRAGTYPRYTANKLYTPLRTDYLNWKAYPGESVTIEGLDIGRHWTQPTFGGYICYMSFEGFHIHNTTTNGGSVVAMNGARYVKLINCTIHGFRNLVDGTSSSFVIDSRENRDILIDGCDISEAHFLVYLWGWNMTLRNSTVHGAHEDAVRIINARNALVEDCEIYDVGEGDDLHNDGIQWFSTNSGAAEQKVPCDNVIIRRVRIHDVEDQDILGNTAPFGLHTNFLFENLLLEQTPSVAWEFNIGDTRAVVRNCTVIGSFRFMPYGEGDVRNCIAGTMLWESNTTRIYEDYNCFNSVSGMAAGPHTLVGISPRYADAANRDYSLRPDSPCIDAGTSDSSALTDYNLLGRVDVHGVANVGGGNVPYYDIGAFEFQGSAGGDPVASLTVASQDLGSGTGSVTVTAPRFWELTLREGTGGGISTFYDLTVDSDRTVNLAPSVSLANASYAGADLFTTAQTQRTLTVVSSDAQTAVIMVSGTLDVDDDTHLPFQAYFTFHAPVYDGTFVDLDVFVTNTTASTIDADQSLILTMPDDPAPATFDFQGSGSTDPEPADRWIRATVGPGCTVPSVAFNRCFKLTELTITADGPAPDLTPPQLRLYGGPGRTLAPTQILYDHFVLEASIAAVPSVMAYSNNAGTGSGTVTVTCPGYFEFVFDEATGSGIRGLYDLRVDPLRRRNLADTTWYNVCMFDMRVTYGPNIHCNNATNRLSIVANDPDHVVVRCTGQLTLSGRVVDCVTDYTFAPPTPERTAVDILVTITNSSGSTIVSSSDFPYLEVAPNPSGSGFDWIGSTDSDADNHWLRATIGPNATASPVTPGLYIQLQEFSYGNPAAVDTTPINLSFRFGTAAYAIGEVRQRRFVLSTGIAAPAPELEVSAAMADGWVYQNAPGSTGNNHFDTLSVTVLNDTYGNTAYSVTVVPTAGTGDVDILPGTTDLEPRVYGGQRQVDGVTGTGSVTLQVTVTGDVGGAAVAQTAVYVRRLGDIDGDGSVTTADSVELAKRLNGLAGSLGTHACDLNADGFATTADSVVLTKVLNSLPIN